ncbi:transmembrane protein 179B-like [Orbicella faveolata]|uniref:transmembrane protein 179B-like n=1 Tax=Orbicella faveolata TaxID=48498 RepID=UPI0009E32C7A|nr:transmembrane protein 179B-like [Orbicella faveolata]
MHFLCQRMNRGEVYENFLYVAALAAGCCISVPLKINESNLKGHCLLFGELDVLTNTVLAGNHGYCTFTFYSSLTNAALAALLGFFKWCCSVDTDSPRVVYFKFTTCILSAIAWINCLVCTIFIVIGFTEWCSSVTNNGNVESCQNAEKWDWTQYTPADIDGSKFYTYLFMAEVASFCVVVIWFIIVILSGRNFKQRLLQARAAQYYITDGRMVYPVPIQEIPVYEIKSEQGSRYL